MNIICARFIMLHEVCAARNANYICESLLQAISMCVVCKIERNNATFERCIFRNRHLVSVLLSFSPLFAFLFAVHLFAVEQAPHIHTFRTKRKETNGEIVDEVIVSASWNFHCKHWPIGSERCFQAAHCTHIRLTLVQTNEQITIYVKEDKSSNTTTATARIMNINRNCIV